MPGLIANEQYDDLTGAVQQVRVSLNSWPHWAGSPNLRMMQSDRTWKL
jgi:hypothetical protein